LLVLGTFVSRPDSLPDESIVHHRRLLSVSFCDQAWSTSVRIVANQPGGRERLIEFEQVTEPGLVSPSNHGVWNVMPAGLNALRDPSDAQFRAGKPNVYQPKHEA